jgi:hypothetical protein
MEPLLESDPVGLHLQTEYRLKVLTLSLDRSEGEPQVVFELTAPDADGPAARAALLTCSSGDLGLPLQLPDLGLPEAAFRLPAEIESALVSAVSYAQPIDGPLWLKFTPPVGLLPGVPWERLLQPVLRVPVLRLPYHRISPAVRSRNLDCVVCFSSPTTVDQASTNALIANFLQMVPVDLLEHTLLHLFGDLNVQPQLHVLKARFGERYDIRLYEPPDTTGRSRGTRLPGATLVENPWLIWMREALGRRKVDVMHFLAHSDVSGEEGCLALARSPAASDVRWEAAYVAAAELAEFLNQTGAWSVAFTSPPDNPSLVGLRLLQDAIARLRPGPCLLHDMAHPVGDDALGEAYRFMFKPEWHPPVASPVVSVYCHPWRALQGAAFDRTSEEILGKVTRLGGIAEEELPGDEHRWLASAQRVLEQSSTSLCDPSPEEVATVEGRRNAVQFVADRIAKYARSTSGGETGEDVDRPPASRDDREP